MATVETVRGPVPIDDLGTVLMHEHVFVLDTEYLANQPEMWDRQTAVADAVERLTELAGRGVRTIVDPTVIGLGRDIHLVAEVNARVDINIIAATGLYTLDTIPMHLHYHGPNTLLGGPEHMVEMFSRDLTEGIAGTGIKAAFLKCAIEDELTPGVERVMNAVAEVHTSTGAPITVHTSAGHQTGLVAQRVIQAAGADLGQVVIGHSGDTVDLDYLRRLIDNGSYLGMDRFGLDILLPLEERVSTVAKLAEQGYAERMMLSQDASCHNVWFPKGVREAALPNWNYTHLHDTVIPMLREAGVTDEQLHTMLVENPRRYFAKR
ncbi:phosphotriesterase [Lentzea sp. NPDC059081]|uniref:phosphotriesterase family protein n=1 Tax=Lentzea sp. NPDC059081 TaxID=3346719 RepID=UPI0036CCF978